MHGFSFLDLSGDTTTEHSSIFGKRINLVRRSLAGLLPSTIDSSPIQSFPEPIDGASGGGIAISFGTARSAIPQSFNSLAYKTDDPPPNDPGGTPPDSPTPDDNPAPDDGPTPFFRTETADSFFFSLKGTQSIDNQIFRDEDIIFYDGQTYSTWFDGSDVGLDSREIDALDVISETEILLSLNRPTTIDGIRFDDSDIIQFTASQIGETTAGNFSLFLDGSDIGLTTSGEDIDGLQLLADGSLLLSVLSTASLPGLSGRPGDEDILQFTPSSLGGNTAGIWSTYLDGSDIGLTNSAEDVKAIAQDADNNVYLSTLGSFSVPGLSGSEDDVFIFSPSSTGSNTAGTFQSPLFVDGNTNGISGFDLATDFTTPPPPPPPTNTDPDALNDSYTLDADTVLQISAPGVLINDNDADGDPLTVSVLTTVNNGSLTLNANGSFNYTPTAGFIGTDSFTYLVDDGNGGTDTATVQLTVEEVTPVNTAPIATNDSFTLDQGSLFSINAPGVLANDSDADGDSLAVSLTTDVSNGNLTLNSNGSFSYTPSVGFSGTDSFTYQVSDGTATDTAIVTLTVDEVIPPNTAPIAANDSFTLDQGSIFSINAPGVLANDTDADGDSLSVSVVNNVNNGNLTLNSNGSFSYTPSVGFSGTDSFTYQVSDGTATDTAIVTLTVDEVIPPNTAPIAANDSYTLSEDEVFSVNAPGVLANDSDADGDSLAVSLTTDVSNGNLTLNGNGSFSYTPAPGFSGVDSFTYAVSDGNGGTDTATVELTVEADPVDPPPTDSEYNIEINFTDDSLSPSQQAVFTDAANRWAEIIVEDVPDIFINGIGLVDDVVIDASAPNIDGPGGTLGSAGPTRLRPGSLLPAAGIMRFDAADLDLLESNGQLENVILHEIAHVLGIGTIWRQLGLVDGSGTSDPQFTGAQATAEYNDLFGLNASSVPLANTGGPGTREGHWRESVFDNELLTGFIDFGRPNPISRVTIGSLADIGYGVNFDAADPYSPPSSGSLGSNAFITDTDPAFNGGAELADAGLGDVIPFTEVSVLG